MATSRDDITVEVAASQYRQAADSAYRAAVGGAAPGHLPGESLAAYRVRLADGLKGFGCGSFRRHDSRCKSLVRVVT